MAYNKQKVFIGMSGGVDSSVAAALLLQDGYECHGMFMITHDNAQSEADDAKEVANKLSIPISILDFREHFKTVIDYFCSEYSKARTPNPCVYCNRKIKFGKLWEYAISKGADYIATGHYIRSVTHAGKQHIYSSTNLAKDQSYVLSMINREVIDRILLPIGEFSKDQIRAKAAELGLGIENKPDSQEICFIPNDDYVARLEQERPQIARKGKILYTDGTLLGEHEGIHKYTIGQRRGLGVAMGHPVYVVGLDASQNTVILGEKKDLYTKTVYASQANWLTEAIGAFDAIVKIRYNHSGKKATVVPGEKNSVIINFEEPISAATPGQTAVFYIQDEIGLRLVGGAWIDSVGELAE